MEYPEYSRKNIRAMSAGLEIMRSTFESWIIWIDKNNTDPNDCRRRITRLQEGHMDLGNVCTVLTDQIRTKKEKREQKMLLKWRDKTEKKVSLRKPRFVTDHLRSTAKFNGATIQCFRQFGDTHEHVYKAEYYFRISIPIGENMGITKFRTEMTSRPLVCTLEHAKAEAEEFLDAMYNLLKVKDHRDRDEKKK